MSTNDELEVNIMNTDRLRDAFEAIVATEPDCLDSEGLAVAVGAASELRAWIDAYEVSCARRSRTLADTTGAEPPESLLTRTGRRSGKETATALERDRVCSVTEHVETALADGKISAGHVDALANATRRLDSDLQAAFFDHEALLLDAATHRGVDTFERECRDLARHLIATKHRSDADELDAQRARANVKRWTDKVTGMRYTLLELDPLRDAKLWTAIDAQIRTAKQADGNAGTPWQQLQVDAVITAVSSGDTGDRIPEIGVLIDCETLLEGWHEHGLCETDDGVALPVSTVRRMCCDADIYPVVLNGTGEVLDVGRTRRSVTRAQRRALRAMHRTCAHPDCTVAFSNCPIHHIHWWTKHHGPTDIDNLLPLCERHHHLVHEGAWTLTMTADRIATWTRPDGTVHHVGTTIDRCSSRPTSTTTPTSRIQPAHRC